MSKPRKKSPKANRNSSKPPTDDFDELRQQAHQSLPFSGLQFIKWFLIVVDVLYCYVMIDGLWQEVVVQGDHGRIYFVLYGFFLIAVAQLFFAATYYAAKLLSRYLTHSKK